MRMIDIDKLEWFQVTFGADEQKAILILKPHINELDNILEIEPTPMARWMLSDTFSPDYECSLCHSHQRGHQPWFPADWKYCPNCGAKMIME